MDTILKEKLYIWIKFHWSMSFKVQLTSPQLTAHNPKELRQLVKAFSPFTNMNKL